MNAEQVLAVTQDAAGAENVTIAEVKPASVVLRVANRRSLIAVKTAIAVRLAAVCRSRAEADGSVSVWVPFSQGAAL